MATLVAAFWADESGFVLTAELVLVGTVVVLGLLTALIAVRDAVGGELTDVAQAMRSLDQSYYYGGLSARKNGLRGFKSWTAGSSYGAQRQGPAVIESAPLRQPDFVCPPEQRIIKPAPAPCITGDCVPSMPLPAPAPMVVPCPPGAPCAPAVPYNGCGPTPLPAPQPLVW